MADLNWESLARASMHPLQVHILERAAKAPKERFSPVQLAADFDQKLGNVSYHVRALYERGLLKKAGTRSTRGAVEHRYLIADKALE